MPIYEYRCGACGADFEKLQRVSDATPTCPRCAASDVSRRVSLSSFQLKGSGWYSTDYKAAPSGATTEATRSNDDTAATTTAEKKPAAAAGESAPAPAPAATPITPST